jgi:hypothetical protein
VQIWSGYLARTVPGWALLSRGVANLAQKQPYVHDEVVLDRGLSDDGPAEVDDGDATPPYENYEGIVETDTWFGPLFTNVRLMRINSPVDFHVDRPLFQVQPIRRESYRDPGFEVLAADDLTLEDWGRYEAVARRNTNHMRRPGAYAAETRRRLRQEDATA